jgi:RNA polymerase II subunit A small phosphatase-like protein
LLNCQQHFDLAVWSSSSADYIDAVVRSALPAGLPLEFTWGRDRCVQRYDPEWQSSYFVKDLKKVKRRGYDLDRVLIVDDTRAKVERNFGNAIYVTQYDGRVDDEELQHLTIYLESIKSAPNVRIIEKRGWRNRF